MEADKTKTIIIVGGILEQDGEYLLVQEAKDKVRGKWNLPAGQLDAGETLVEGMKREVREESGFEVEPTGVCQIGSRVRPDTVFAAIIFTTKIKSGEIKFDPEEILDAKWFSYEEIIALGEKIRSRNLLIGAIDNVRNKIIAPLEILSNYD